MAIKMKHVLAGFGLTIGIALDGLCVYGLAEDIGITQTEEVTITESREYVDLMNLYYNNNKEFESYLQEYVIWKYEGEYDFRCYNVGYNIEFDETRKCFNVVEINMAIHKPVRVYYEELNEYVNGPTDSE